jgi:hypothetical protein
MTKDKSIDTELIDNLLKNYKKPEDLIGENGLLKQLTKQLLERAMAAEMTEHVGYEKHDPGGNNSGNSRNGQSAKTLKGTFGELARRRRGIATGPSSRRSSRSIRRGSPGSTRTSCPCTRAGCRPARSSSTWKRSMEWK